MTRFVSLLFLSLFFVSSTVIAQDPDPFGASTLQARALRGLTGEVATLILKAEPGGELAMEALAIPLPDSAEPGDKRRVAVFLEIDGTSFLELNQAETARLEIYVYALAADGFTVADYRAEVTAVEVATLGEIVWQSGIKYYGELSLPPGSYRLRALVRNFQSKVAGLVESAIEVPAHDPGIPLLPPIFPDPVHREPWLPVRAWRDDVLTGLMDEPLDGIQGRQPNPYPFSFAGQAIRPAAQPVLVLGRSTTLYLQGRALPSATYSLEILQNGDNVSASIPLEVIDREDRDGLVVLEARLATPAELRPGSVELRAKVETSEGTLRSMATTAHFVGSQVREQNLLWSDLRWRGLSEAEQTAGNRSTTEAPSRTRRKPGRKAQKLAQSYRALLAELQKQGDSAIMSRLIDFETGVLNDGSRKATALLQTAEFQVATELGNHDPESLVPLIQLHLDLYLAYRGRRLFSLGTHSRIMMERLAELYAEKGNSQGSRILAARALTSLGAFCKRVV